LLNEGPNCVEVGSKAHHKADEGLFHVEGSSKSPSCNLPSKNSSKNYNSQVKYENILFGWNFLTLYRRKSNDSTINGC
jgi:hypothetical protein